MIKTKTLNKEQKHDIKLELDDVGSHPWWPTLQPLQRSQAESVLSC